MNRISEFLRTLFWSYAFVYVVVGSLQITQVDIWWQLSEGFHILRTFHVPTEPVAAFGLPASPYFDEYAGYETFLACIYHAAGFPGVWLFFIAVYLTTIFLPSLYSRRAHALYDFWSGVALLSAGILMRNRLEQRPELVGSLLLVLLMVLLRKSKLETVTFRSSIALFFIFLVWTNTHSSFVFGLFTLFLWLGCEIILKYRDKSIGLLCKNGFLLVAITSVALLINPYGGERLGFPLSSGL